MIRTTFAVIVLALGLVPGPAPVWASEGAPAPVRTGQKPNVLIFLVDTLRADHLGVYGYERETSPHLDAWAKQAVVFEQAYAPSSWTRPSVVSLMSALDPIRHGVEDRLDVVPNGIGLLSERLRNAGYSTYAAVTNPNVLPKWGLGRGFDVFVDLDATGQGIRADDVTRWAEAQLDDLEGERPFLLYLHLLDPHTPYDPPPPFDERYSRSPALPADQSIGRYDGEVAFVDEQFGRLMRALDARGLADETLVVFVSDHGEELMDHGAIGHGYSLFEEVIRVPLLMRLPKGAHAGARVPGSISLVDVAPTVLSQIGLPPMPGVDGRDLSPLLEGRETELEERDVVLSLYTTGTGSHLVRGLIDGPHKYLRRSRPSESEQLFDLRSDPHESENRATKAPEVLDLLAARLDARVSQTSKGVHLRVVASPSAEAAKCEVILVTTGRFVDVEPVRLEAEDRFELVEEGRILRWSGTLENLSRAFADGDRLIPDEDGLVFRVEPPDAQIEIQRLQIVGDRAIPLSAGQASETPNLPFAFDPSAPEWRVRDVGELMRAASEMTTAAGAFLGVIGAPESAPSISETMRQRLRALGYIVP